MYARLLLQCCFTTRTLSATTVAASPLQHHIMVIPQPFLCRAAAVEHSCIVLWAIVWYNSYEPRTRVLLLQCHYYTTTPPVPQQYEITPTAL
eukprot:6098818-Pyramimonas_sp.AAC.1